MKDLNALVISLKEESCGSSPGKTCALKTSDLSYDMAVDDKEVGNRVKIFAEIIKALIE